MRFITALLVLILTVSFPAWSFCAEAEFHDPFEEVGRGIPEVADPLEPLNRISFWINDKVYRYLLTPLCGSISSTVRETLLAGLSRLLAPVKTDHGGLEFRFRDAGSEFGRFALENLLDLLDETEQGEREDGGDLESLLARSGVGPGPYLVLPILGPSTARDGVGKIASFYLESPAALFSPEDPFTAEERDTLGKTLESYRSICRLALDPYLSVRNLFTQQQEKENRENLFAAQPFGGVHLMGPRD